MSPIPLLSVLGGTPASLQLYSILSVLRSGQNWVRKGASFQGTVAFATITPAADRNQVVTDEENRFYSTLG